MSAHWRLQRSASKRLACQVKKLSHVTILFGRYYKVSRSTVLSLHRKILSHTNTYVNVSLLIRAEQQIKVVFIPNEKMDVDVCVFLWHCSSPTDGPILIRFFAFESQFPCSDSKL